MITDREKYNLTVWQALLLLLLEWFTKRDWAPIEEDPVNPAPPELPDFVLPFGDVSRYQSVYSPSDRKAVFEVFGDQVAVFFSDPKQAYNIRRPDGTTAIKHVFTARTSQQQPTMINVQPGARILTYYKAIPTNPETDSKAYADGQPYLEICDPAGGVIRIRNVRRLGYQMPDGSWVDEPF